MIWELPLLDLVEDTYKNRDLDDAGRRENGIRVDGNLLACTQVAYIYTRNTMERVGKRL